MKRNVFQRLAPLLTLATIELGWCLYLASTRTIPRGHDGFQYFYLKYYFFNDFVRNGEVAEWLPYLTHGSPAAWWYIVQSGIFDPLTLFAARLLHLQNFFVIFYSLLFLEKLLLISGMWLLAAEHIRSRPAIFAVTAAVSSTSIWFTQPWWNFHALLAMPMMLFLLHRAIMDFRWRWWVGLSLLLYLQTFGHLSYYLPMTLLCLAMYAVQLIARPDVWAGFRTRVRFNPAGLLVFIVVNVMFLVELIWLRRSSSEMAFSRSLRGADGTVTLETFLNYAGYTDLRGWNGFFLGLTPHLDFTLFAGFLIAGLTMLTWCLGPLTRSQRTFAWLTASILLLSTASPLATVVFYFWPLAQLFRHLALLAPIAKLFCICLAGTTLDRLFDEPSPRWPRTRLVTVLATLLPWLALLVWFLFDRAPLQTFLNALTTDTLPVVSSYGTRFIQERLIRGALFLALTIGGLVAVLGTRRPTEARTQKWAWALALLLLADVSTYEVSELGVRMVSLTPREAEVFQFRNLPYAERRSESPDGIENQRLQNLLRVAGNPLGASYWAENLLWMEDSYRTSKRTVYWSTALDSLLRALSGNNISRIIGPGETFDLPTDDLLLTSISGLRDPKVRFFSDAIACPDAASTATLLANPEYRGQIPLVTAVVPTLRACDASSLTSGLPVAAPPTVQVSGFTSNRVVFEVQNPAVERQIMTYSDGWDNHWEVRIDNKVEQLFRSDLAYKAVAVPPGPHRIEFQYRDRMGEWVFASQAVSSFGLLVFLGFLVYSRLSAPSPDASSQTSFATT